MSGIRKTEQDKKILLALKARGEILSDSEGYHKGLLELAKKHRIDTEQEAANA